MSNSNSSNLVLYNMLVMSVIFVEAYALGFMWEDLDLVKNPLIVTAVCTGSLALLSSLGLYWLQGRPPMKRWQMAKGLVLVMLAACLFHLITVLYGAPLTQSVAETFSFSSLLAVLTVLPPCVVFGIDNRTWLRIYAHNRPETTVEACVQLTTMCSLVGAWVGAFPIPLDWDRPWQAWPVTCVAGALGGNMVGQFWSAYTAGSRADHLQKAKLG